jgi:hypothetical protein
MSYSNPEAVILGPQGEAAWQNGLTTRTWNEFENFCPGSNIH